MIDRWSSVGRLPVAGRSPVGRHFERDPDERLPRWKVGQTRLKFGRTLQNLANVDEEWPVRTHSVLSTERSSRKLGGARVTEQCPCVEGPSLAWLRASSDRPRAGGFDFVCGGSQVMLIRCVRSHCVALLRLYWRVLPADSMGPVRLSMRRDLADYLRRSCISGSFRPPRDRRRGCSR